MITASEAFHPEPPMPTRRAFLGTLAAAATTRVPLRAMEPVSRSGPARMRLSLAAYSFRTLLQDRRRPVTAPARMSLGDFVDLCARYGLDGTEPTSYYIPDPIPPGYLQGLRRRAFLQGLSISGTAIGNTFTHPPGQARDREIDHTKAWIDRAAELGAPVIRVFAGNLQEGTTEADARRWTIEALEECCAYAGAKGIVLALENHGGIVTTAEQLLSIVRDVKSPWFGVNWDSGNFRSADAYAELRAVAPYAVTAQIKTTVGSPEGAVKADLPRVIAILREAGYQGFVALEYEEEEDPMTAVPRYLDRLRALIDG
jgi:sugar phosphate isomerase/epimerase